jgi:hypothetical protein
MPEYLPPAEDQFTAMTSLPYLPPEGPAFQPYFELPPMGDDLNINEAPIAVMPTPAEIKQHELRLQREELAQAQRGYPQVQQPLLHPQLDALLRTNNLGTVSCVLPLHEWRKLGYFM